MVTSAQPCEPTGKPLPLPRWEADASMQDVVVFAKTVRGYSHTRRDIPCQDASQRWSDPDGRFAIAVVADGHGDPTCVRSDRGSRIVAQTTTDTLREFAELSLDFEGQGFAESPIHELTVPGHDAEVVKRLTDAIVSRWYKAVMQDVANNPLTPDELQRAAAYAERYEATRDLDHAYGTTLVAALRIDKLLLLLQQGDGRCVLINEDASATEPIPWDVRCHANVTTSVSDEDAAESFRHAVIDEDTLDAPIAACLLMSDGVEDAYRADEGRWDYCRHLCMLLTQTRSAKTRDEDFEAMLDEELPAFSKAGSGDDVSVAGMANIRTLMQARATFEDILDTHKRAERLRQAREKLMSMERMHLHLMEKARGGSKGDKAAFDAYNAKYEQVKTQIASLEQYEEHADDREG